MQVSISAGFYVDEELKKPYIKNINTMKTNLTTLLAFMLCLSCNAWGASPDSLNLYSPQNTSGYSEWKGEFTVRGGVQVAYKWTDITGGVRLTPNHVVGAGVGLGTKYYDAVPADDYHFRFFAYHRYYIPLSKNRRISLYSDLMLGGRYVYKATEVHPDVPDKGSVKLLFSWQPGIALRLWGKSNIFVGPNIGPSIGLHVGLTI